MARVGHRGRAMLVATALAAPSLGCASPNLYTTPRAIAKGKNAFVVAPELVALSYRERPGAPRAQVARAAPAVPVIAAREAITDRVDVGLRLANVTSLGVDAKVELLRGPVLDVAITPSAMLLRPPPILPGDGAISLDTKQQFLAGGASFGLPLLVGINLGRVTLLTSPGIGHGLAYLRIVDTEQPTALRAALFDTGLLLRLGLGLQARITDRFALQPEMTALRSVRSDGPLQVSLGLAMIFGQSAHAPPGD